MKNQDKGSAALGRTIVFNIWAKKKNQKWNFIFWHYSECDTVIKESGVASRELRATSYELKVYNDEFKVKSEGSDSRVMSLNPKFKFTSSNLQIAS